MADLKLDEGVWVLVCDGAKGLVLENVGSRKFPNLRTREVFSQENQKTGDLASDAPGRSFQSFTTARSAMEQTDIHDQNEQRFLAMLAERLDRAVQDGETKAVIVVAPPRALGVLRPLYSKHVRQALRAELDKDLVKHPVHEIESYLAG